MEKPEKEKLHKLNFLKFVHHVFVTISIFGCYFYASYSVTLGEAAFAENFAPEFDIHTSTNLTVTALKPALLPCTVYNLGNNTVSWIRHEDLHIVSVGEVTYSNDERFKVLPGDKSEWNLRIQYSNVRDTGQYDCQLSTTPPKSRTIHLTVVEPQARIGKGPELYVSAGSSINLTCVVQDAPDVPEFLDWHLQEKVLEADDKRIFIKTKFALGATASHLFIKNVNVNDGGVYTCSPAYAREHAVNVHIVTEGHPAAMQGQSSITSVGHLKLTCLVAMSVSVPILYRKAINV